MSVGIIDYGVGNVASITNILDRIEAYSELVKTPEELHLHDIIILPGVGAFDAAISKLKEAKFVEPLRQLKNNQNKKILGICLGMQLLGYGSDEGVLQGLGLIEAYCKKLPNISGTNYKVPNMGWHYIETEEKHNRFLNRELQRYYFAHSYYMLCKQEFSIAATIDRGHKICVAVNDGNVYGVQFHPEKSHVFGMNFFKDFCKK